MATLDANSNHERSPAPSISRLPVEESAGLGRMARYDDVIEEIREEDDMEKTRCLEMNDENCYGSSDDEMNVSSSSRRPNETFAQFLDRQYKNVVHFLMEDWLVTAMLGVGTAILSILTDVSIDTLLHFRIFLYNLASDASLVTGVLAWIVYIVFCAAFASFACKMIARQAVGSGIPEVKVIMSGFELKNYLTLRTLLAKIVGLIFAIGGGLPVGKEGPFVHMGAIVATLLRQATASCRYNKFFSERREKGENELLSSGCAVGIACTFSAPAGGVLYGIESTSQYFAVKDYWRSFFATTCAALVFRFSMSLYASSKIEGTTAAYYQTYFPNEVFLYEEIPFFILLGIFSGIFGSFFVFVNKSIVLFEQKNKIFRKIFGKNPVLFTAFVACIVGMFTYPQGMGSYIAGKMTFRETLTDFISNCTFSQINNTDIMCNRTHIEAWTGGNGSLTPIFCFCCYAVAYFFLVAVCITLFVPAGIFVPSFVIGACGGRLMGEIIATMWPHGLRGAGGPQIYPGLYAVVGAAAYTGSVTHSLSIAVIVCETTGQLSALLPVLIALMVAIAIASFLQPSIYESIIHLKNLPYLTHLPPSRISVHKLKVDKVMLRDIVYISRNMTYKELIEIIAGAPHFSSYPFVTDPETRILLGSVSRRHLLTILHNDIGSTLHLELQNMRDNGADVTLSMDEVAEIDRRGLRRQLENGLLSPVIGEAGRQRSVQERSLLLGSTLTIDKVHIDPAPFQLVSGISMYKVHKIFSLLGLKRAYVTERGRLVGVVSINEIRGALSNIYFRGAQAPQRS